MAHFASMKADLVIYSQVLDVSGPGLKVGWMTRAIWVTWVTFLVGQVGLICKLNCLDVTSISHVL